MDTFDSDTGDQVTETGQSDVTQGEAGVYAFERYDVNGDGSTDAEFIDQNLDGVADIERYDTDGDGVTNIEYIDTNHDGFADQALFDTNNDGTADVELTSSTISTDASEALFPDATGAVDLGTDSTDDSSETTLTAHDVVESALPGPEYTA